jgi:ribosomal-protein-serine acetyltransferase
MFPRTLIQRWSNWNANMPRKDVLRSMFTYDLGDGAELRILEARHAEEFLNFIAANRAYLGEYLGWALDMQTVEDARAFIQRGLTRFAEDGLPWVGIWQDGEMAGGLLFFPLDRRIRATEIGYWLGAQAAGRGLMTRAARAMLGFVFDELDVNRVGLQAEVGNQRSRAVADRLGFMLEGVRRQAWVGSDGAFVDIATYSLLANEWQARTDP